MMMMMMMMIIIIIIILAVVVVAAVAAAAVAAAAAVVVVVIIYKTCIHVLYLSVNVLIMETIFMKTLLSIGLAVEIKPVTTSFLVKSLTN